MKGMKKQIVFEIEYKIEYNNNGELIESPSDWFIEGGLVDLEYSHGLKCENIKIKKEKNE